MLVTCDCAHAIVKLSFVFNCGFYFGDCLKVVRHITMQILTYDIIVWEIMTGHMHSTICACLHSVLLLLESVAMVT